MLLYLLDGFEDIRFIKNNEFELLFFNQTCKKKNLQFLVPLSIFCEFR